MGKLIKNEKDMYISVSNDNSYFRKSKKTSTKLRKAINPNLEKGSQFYYEKDTKLNELNNTIDIDSIRYKHISSMGPSQRIILHHPDARVKVPQDLFPYKDICLLLIEDNQGNTYYGTGFFISERCVITAGHCVFYNGDWVDEICVIPGANGNDKPFGKQISTNFKSVLGWTNDSKNDFDHGAIILNDNTLFKNINAVFEFKPFQNEYKGEISGYPSDKDGTQWKGEGSIYSSTDYRLFYDIDTVTGNSGSPVYIEDGDRRIVIGIHSFGDNPNSAVSVNQEIINLWNDWSNL